MSTTPLRLPQFGINQMACPKGTDGEREYVNCDISWDHYLPGVLSDRQIRCMQITRPYRDSGTDLALRQIHNGVRT